MSNYFPTVGVKDNQNDRELMITTTRELRTTEIVRLVGRGFEGVTIDTNYWTPTVVTGGTVVQDHGIVSLKTTTELGSNAKVVSTDIARYISSSSNIFRWTGRFTTAGVANNIRRLGCYDGNNGFFFQLNGTTFAIGSRKNTVDTLITDFNGSLGTSYTLNTNNHAFEIVYGVGTMEFYIDGELLHKLNSSTDPLTAAYSFPATFENYNTGAVTGAPQLDCRGASISRLGKFETAPTSSYIKAAGTTTLKIGSGYLKRIILGVINNGAELTVYDSLAGSGTVLAKIKTSNAANPPISLEFGIPFNIGLTIVTSNGTAAYTVVYE